MPQSCPKSSTDIIVPSEYKMAPMFRRIPIYIFLTGPAILITLALFGKSDWLPIIMFGSIAALLATMLESWRLRVDSEGITRHRWLLGWDHFAWKDFRSGAIRGGMGTRSFIKPGSQPCWRTLDLSFLREAEARYLEELIASTMPPPEPPLPQDAVTVRLWKRHWPTLMRVDAQGIEFHGLRDMQVYSWDSLQSASLERATHRHLDFLQIELVFSDRKLKLSMQCPPYGRSLPARMSARYNQIAALILHYAPRERLRVLARWGPPQTDGEAQVRLERLRKKYRKGLWISWILGGAGFLSLTAGLVTCRMAADKMASFPFFFFAFTVMLLVLCIFQYAGRLHVMIQELETGRGEIQARPYLKQERGT